MDHQQHHDGNNQFDSLHNLSRDKRDESSLPRGECSVNTYEGFVLKDEHVVQPVRTPSLRSTCIENKDSYAGESLLDFDEIDDTDSSASTMYEDPVSSSIPLAAVEAVSQSRTISSLRCNTSTENINHNHKDDRSPEKKKKLSSKDKLKLRLLSRKASPAPSDLVSTSGSFSDADQPERSARTHNNKRRETQQTHVVEEGGGLGDNILDDTFMDVPLHPKSPRAPRSSPSVISMDSSSCDDNVSAPFTMLERIPYVHGSFAPAAPMMLQDSRWMRILRRVMPESHADALTILCQERKLVPNPVRIMKWAENNPVVAAYGVVTGTTCSQPELYSKNARRPPSTKNFSRDDSANTGFRCKSSPDSKKNRFSRSIARALGRRNESTSYFNAPVLEWDVFLDPNLVRKLEQALVASDDEKENGEETASIAADVEVDRVVSCLVNRMFLAHGSTSQLVSEAFGLNRKYNFASVVEQGESQRLHRRRRPSELPDRVDSNEFDTKKYLERYERRMSSRMSFLAEVEAESDRVVAPFVPGKGQAKAGGIFVERWLACFAKALQMAIEPNNHESDPWRLLDEIEQENDLGDDDDYRQVKPSMCGVFLCLGYDDPNSAKAHHTKTCMAQNTAEIARLLGSPLRVVLDMKSRRVPPRVWGRLVTTLHSRGLHVEGLGSFDVDELRDIGNFISPLVSQIIFFHSVGDLQRAIHANEVKHGDTVYFNAGSLIWNKPKSLASKLSCWNPDSLESAIDVSDMMEYQEQPFFHPCAYPHKESKERFTDMECKSTLEDYQKKLNLNIGCYVQEFSISEQTLDAIVQHMNQYQGIYNLGLAWGGINGRTALGVLGDGYWNQRYMGRLWDLEAEPSDAMHLLNIEDHHLVKKALQTGAWAHIGMVNPVNDVGGDATGEGAQLNFEACKPVE